MARPEHFFLVATAYSNLKRDTISAPAPSQRIKRRAQPKKTRRLRYDERKLDAHGSVGKNHRPFVTILRHGKRLSGDALTPDRFGANWGRWNLGCCI